ncbi:MAG: glutaminyl-peptide cyclotransferase [Caulobacterales bacterium]|nr:glutaminyl-peptide cyclotransferase [Caulobacterales bacterium]
MIRLFRLPALVSAVVWVGGCGAVAAQTAPEPPPTASIEQPPHPPVELFEVVAVYPHDPGAFTQGLIYVDGRMFESTGQFPSTVREVSLEDGAVLVRTELEPTLFGEGLTELNGRLYSLTWRDQRGFIWNPDDLSAPVGEFSYSGEGWGLTTDGTSLILSDGTPVIRFLDPGSFEVTRELTVTFRGQTVRRLNELEWVDGQILANLWLQDLIVRIDPATGQVVGVIDLTDLFPVDQRVRPRDDVLNGIAWDAEARRLFVTGKNWPHLFEIRLVSANGPAS